MRRSIFLLLLFLCGCTSFVPTKDVLANDIQSATKGEYIAIEPLPTDSFISYASSCKDKTKCTNKKEIGYTVFWKDMSNKEINDKLSIEESSSTIEKINADGSLTILNSKFSGEAGRYKVTFDYGKFTHLNYGDSNSTCTDDGWFRVGVGVRLVSEVVTKKGNIDIGNIFALSSGVKAGDITGSVKIQKIGINSKSLNMIIPPPTDISDASLQVAMQAMTTIRAQLYDTETKLTPYKIAKRRPEAP